MDKKEYQAPAVETYRHRDVGEPCNRCRSILMVSHPMGLCYPCYRECFLKAGEGEEPMVKKDVGQEIVRAIRESVGAVLGVAEGKAEVVFYDRETKERLADEMARNAAQSVIGIMDAMEVGNGH